LRVSNETRYEALAFYADFVKNVPVRRKNALCWSSHQVGVKKQIHADKPARAGHKAFAPLPIRGRKSGTATRKPKTLQALSGISQPFQDDESSQSCNVPSRTPPSAALAALNVAS
jgi:hypothetical protein